MNENIFNMTFSPVLYNEAFTEQDAATLTAGGQIEKDERVYISARAEKAVYIYRLLPTYRSPALHFGGSPEFCGFIVENKVYTDFDGINAAFRHDLKNAYMDAVKDEEAAAAMIEKYQYADWELRDLRYALQYDRDESIEKHFYAGTLPTFDPLTGEDKISGESLIDYIIDPAAVVQEYATATLEAALPRIYAKYHVFNKIMEGLQELKNDTGRIEHKIKAMAATITDQKTVKLALACGASVKVEANAIKYLGGRKYISTYDVISSDRDKLPRNDYNRPDDIKPADILTISHGSKILYTA